MKRFECAICAVAIGTVFILFLLLGVVAGGMFAQETDFAQHIPTDLRHEQPPALASK